MTTFKDLFTEMYINTARLSDIGRLFHLVRKTTGEVREMVSKFQLNILWDIPMPFSETSSNLKSIQCGINGYLTSMSIYDVRTGN